MTRPRRTVARTESAAVHVKRTRWWLLARRYVSIEAFIEGYNQRVRPFVWTATTDPILNKAISQQPTSGDVTLGGQPRAAHKLRARGDEAHATTEFGGIVGHALQVTRHQHRGGDPLAPSHLITLF